MRPTVAVHAAIHARRYDYDRIFSRIFPNSVFQLSFVKSALNTDGYWRFFTPRSHRYPTVLAPR